MSTESTQDTNVPPEAARKFAVDVLTHANVPPNRANIVADCLVRADLRGVDTHGINRLPIYISRVRAGVLDPSAELSFQQKSPVMASLDAKDTFGFVAGHLAIERAVGMAENFGVGIVGVKNSGHYGMAASYLLQAIDKGFAAFAFTNASRSLPAWGSKEPLFGTNPFAVGFPGGKKGNFILDMAPSVVARVSEFVFDMNAGINILQGKVRKAARRGESIPEGWMLDGEGRDTTDPVEALKGVVLPIGGPKGSGIAMMLDIFGGLMTGSAYGGDVKDQYKDFEGSQGVGHWFMVLRPEMFLDSKQEYLDRMDILFDKVRNSEKAAGISQIYTPGEIEDLKESAQRESGIPFTAGEIEALHDLAKDIGSNARLV